MELIGGLIVLNAKKIMIWINFRRQLKCKKLCIVKMNSVRGQSSLRSHSSANNFLKNSLKRLIQKIYRKQTFYWSWAQLWLYNHLVWYLKWSHRTSQRFSSIWTIQKKLVVTILLRVRISFSFRANVMRFWLS